MPALKVPFDCILQATLKIWYVKGNIGRSLIFSKQVALDERRHDNTIRYVEQRPGS